MTNRETYADGLLNRALDPITQPASIRAFLREEVELLGTLIPQGASVIDFGCGAGRHLIELAERIGVGVGLDYEPSSIEEAVRVSNHASLHFVVADGTRAPFATGFDVAVCLTSTWGTMPEKMAVLAEMKRLAPTRGGRFITVYGPGSIEPRREWYARLDLPVTDVSDEALIAGGFRSEHFSEERLRGLLGECELHPLGDIAFLARF